ncbi:hypothetical protein TanjilG_04550 [Lupinus angustifolius]|uniref:VQ domain-containing protein n=2 Tax=Lupinus angustifolius TaxID=3871 RepID=A0A4P1RR71_LUPAN|nr:hypothetical protein TanjilG_04550 [Lupinus angustifolius]
MALGAVALNKLPQRHRVIIYTHSPKVIHTHPRDFMALVQKLTGLSRSEEDGDDSNLPPPKQAKQELVSNNIAPVVVSKESDRKNVVVGTEDNETSSVITEENNCTNNISENQVNSCFVSPPILEPPVNPYLANLPPVFMPPSSSEFMCSSQPLLNYPNSFYFSHNMRSSLEGVNDFSEY